MKKVKKLVYKLICVAMCVVCMPAVSFAHSGRTDGSGGHKDNKNKSGLGYYHYHCGGYPAHLHDEGYCKYTDILPSKVSVKVDKNTLGIGEKTSISASVSPTNAISTSVSWSNSNPNVVKLDEYEGTIEAIGFGTSTITATAINGKKTNIKITVKEITADKVTIQEELTSLNIGDTFELSAVISPENVDNPTITWSSTDDTIATVDQNRKVEALAAGNVTISAAASNGVKDSRTIEVKEVIAEKIEIKIDSAIIHRKISPAKVVFYPENTTFQEIEWKVSDENIVQIDANGNIKGVNVGKTQITAIQKDVETSVEIEVVPLKVEKIDILASVEGKVYLGDTVKFTAEITPLNATYPTVYWKVEDEDVAVINEKGVLEANGLGTTTVIAYTEDGCEARYEVQVAIPPLVMVISLGVIGVVGARVVTKKRKAESVESDDERKS